MSYGWKRIAVRNRHTAVLILGLFLLQPAVVSIAAELSWSLDPGAYERHLQRRYNNPLFPPSRQRVTLQELRIAQARDRTDAEAIRQEFYDLLQEIEGLPSLTTQTDVSVIRERIDDLHDKAAEVGGLSNVINGLIKIRKAVIDTWRKAIVNNPAALAALERAESLYRARARIAYNPFVAQMSRIPSEEIVPALLTEDADTIRIAMEILDEGTKETVRQAAVSLLLQMGAEGKAIPDVGKKLVALGVKK